MCSEGVSVWFACKWCESFFLNADDFAYHKKKSHAQEFQNTKFIVFEEQTTPTASPPENWVSFLSPKEETQIHRIISSTSSPTKINFDCSSNNGKLQSIRNEECTKIDPERNTVLNARYNGSDGAGNKSHNLQTVVQALHNPYVHLKKINLRKTVQNASSQSNGTTQFQENDRHHTKSNADTANQPKVTHGDREQCSRSNSAISSPPFATLQTCQFCSVHFNSTGKLIVHEKICRLKRQFENILCVPCLVTFGSSDELSAHNQTFHSSSGSASDVTKHRTENSDDLEAVPETKIETYIFLANDDHNRMANLPVSKNYDNNSNNDNGDFDEKITEESSASIGLFPTESILPDVFSLNQSQKLNIPYKQNVTSGPSKPSGVNLSYAPLLEVVKTEFTHSNEESGFPGEGPDPLETESGMQSSAKKILSNAAYFPKTKDAESQKRSSKLLKSNNYRMSLLP